VGYWLAYRTDASGEFTRIIPIAVFDSEVRALRYALANYCEVEFREFGELP
jgi:hypothetical protein